jgi:hypothetical protein
MHPLIFGESNAVMLGFVGFLAAGRLDSIEQFCEQPWIDPMLPGGASDRERRKTRAFLPILRRSETKLQKGC